MQQQFAQFWIQAGGNPAMAPIAAALGMAEGSSDPYGINPDSGGSQSAGIWQINSSNWPALIKAGIINSPQDLTDPIKNAEAAIFISGNGKNFHPWTTFWSNDGGKTNSGDGNGAFTKYLSNPSGMAATTPGSSSQSQGDGNPITAVAKYLNPMGMLTQAIGGGSSLALSAGATLVGIGLLVVGVIWLAGYEVTASGLARKAVEGAGAGRALAALA